MKVSELIDKLRAMNTGVDQNVYLRDEQGRLWDVGFEPTRVDYHGPAPYEDDNDYPFAMVLVPDPLRWQE